MLKVLLLLSAACLSAYATPLLGEKKCTWGPTYWCSNITNAAGCHAVHHCIQTVWVHKELPPDTDTVCQTCLKMVKEARDQLESNETQEEIKEVFEGSCKLIPVRVINKECCKLADEFIPELIDTLASEMNPQTVCSVAGLCNNDRVDKLLEEYESSTHVIPARDVNLGDTCQGCQTVIGIMENKFHKMSRDEVLQSLLKVCGHMSSFSDSCSNIVVTYFTKIYNHLVENFNSDQVCLLAGECSAKFHVHANVEVTPLSHIGYVPIENKDDLPCDLCKQLVGHLRDLLVANTTELEFKKVLEGICKQTGSFKDECISLVDQYYSEVYNFLVDQLNTSAVCIMTGICPTTSSQDVAVMPLLLSETVPKVQEIVNSPKNSKSSVQILQSPEQMQLPIERLTPMFGEIYNNEVCVFCEYFLHYLQQAITNPATVQEIKDVVDKGCNKLPSSINETCIQFVNTYGDAMVALLAQEIDPSVVCPTLRACPSSQAVNVEIFMEAKPEKPNCPLCLFAVSKLEELITDKKSKDSIKNGLSQLCQHLSGNLREECDDFVHTYTDELIELMIADLTPQEICVYLKLCTDKAPAPTLPPLSHTTTTVATPSTTEFSNDIFDDTANGKYIGEVKEVKNKPQCVICEFAMDQLEHMLQNKTTDDEIINAVHGLCNHLPRSVSKECNQFVNQYADTVIALLTSALKPDEICAYLKLCDPTRNVKTTQAPDLRSPQCTLCKMVMIQLEKMIDGKIDKDSVESAMHKVCNALPNSMKMDCNSFVDKYGDQIVELITQAVQPGEICSLLFFCTEKIDLIKLEITKCAVCEQVALVIQRLLNNPKIDHSIEHILEKTCRALPNKDQDMCREMVDIYGSKLFDLISHMSDTHKVCHEINLCAAIVARPHQGKLVGSNKCTWGPSYWCETLEQAQGCNAVKHCQEKHWGGASSPRSKRQVLPGANKCSRGPGYWCKTLENAQECNAVEHCKENQWGGADSPRPLLGAKKCTWGPSYWCGSLETAQECNAIRHCKEKHWAGADAPPPRPKRQTLVGANKCTWGPGYWCNTLAKAQECNAVQHCKENHWGGRDAPPPRSKRQVGANKCTWGPGYWCANLRQAQECNAIQHCRENVWRGGVPSA